MLMNQAKWQLTRLICNYSNPSSEESKLSAVKSYSLSAPSLRAWASEGSKTTPRQQVDRQVLKRLQLIVVFSIRLIVKYHGVLHESIRKIPQSSLERIHWTKQSSDHRIQTNKNIWSATRQCSIVHGRPGEVFETILLLFAIVSRSYNGNNRRWRISNICGQQRYDQNLPSSPKGCNPSQRKYHLGR